jgi:hypothetical protein
MSMCIKLSLDLLDVATMEDLLEDAFQDQHRYSKEPTFSQTGVGSLLPTSIEDYAKERERNSAIIQKLEERVAQRGDHF